MKKVSLEKKNIRYVICIFLCCCTFGFSLAQESASKAIESNLTQQFRNPPESAKPWVFWYWMKGAVTRKGITTDLETMKAAGIFGAYLVPIQEAPNPPLIDPPVNTLTPEWWEMLRYAFREAERLGLKFTMHSGDGFATSGGPWITPDLSMQKVVWSQTLVDGNIAFNDTLSQPSLLANYYRDIAILAFPSPVGAGISTRNVIPKITTSNGTEAGFLIKSDSKETFKSDSSCWIQYSFAKPFTCRSVITRAAVYCYQAHRLRIETSNDGKEFHFLCQLAPSRNGWLDGDVDYTHSIPPVTARYFRFYYNKAGSEPGAEDNEMAKWKPNLKLRSLELLSEAVIHQYEGKSGVVWRVGKRTPEAELADSLCVPLNKIVDITGKFRDGKLQWKVPAGRWTILRIGHTSTGHMNMTAGTGKGLECDKFNPEAVKLQFHHWFGEIELKLGHDLTSHVLSTIHIDSWECGSQNWSPVFRDEFKKRRGYDPKMYLLAMAGIPVQSASVSECFLYDVRQTISDLVTNNFYGTMSALAKESGYLFSGESAAPVMTGDGMLHYKKLDIPMGEFWVNSLTHDKPTDMLEAISAAHIYGKKIVQSEAFTTLRMDWNEYPGMLKPIGDRNYGLGINRFVFHVFCQNPWPDRKPGMTLGPTGILFQPTQTWWKPARAWMEYTRRCQALLQIGSPVVDVAVFTGEEIPRRAILPERLLTSIPGIIGKDAAEKEKLRLENRGNPVWEKPDGVFNSANTSDPANWIDALHGYQYDSFNPDALLNLAHVKNGRIELPGGASYKLLIIPAANPMMPGSGFMTRDVAEKLQQLIKDGATVLLNNNPSKVPGLTGKVLGKSKDFEFFAGVPAVSYDKISGEKLSVYSIGKGRLLREFNLSTFDLLGLERDIIFTDSAKKTVSGFSWTHRCVGDTDIYFISNQQSRLRTVNLSLRASGRIPELFNPVTGENTVAGFWNINNGRTEIPIQLDAYESMFVVLQRPAGSNNSAIGKNWIDKKVVLALKDPWTVKFDTAFGGPQESLVFDTLADWSKQSKPSVKYYSGTAIYSTNLVWNENTKEGQRLWLDLGKVCNIAEVKVNGISCGVAWTFPYRVDITKALKHGNNALVVEVTNTWINRLIGDNLLPINQRVTYTATPPYRIESKTLKESGLLGPVLLLKSGL